MRQSRLTEEQIVQILKSAEAGMGTDELCRKHGVSRQTFYRWRSKYGGLDVDEAKRLKALEDENRRLKRVVADLTLDKQKVRHGLIKPDARFREEGIVVPYAMSKTDIPVRRLDRVVPSP